MKLNLTVFLILATTLHCLAAPQISPTKITAIQRELFQENAKRGSATSKRRAYKNIIRDAESLLTASPAAANRFKVLALMFDAQKRLVGIENTDRTRGALFETCEELAKAPDEFAAYRVEADMLLMEKTMSENNADIKQRAEALKKLVERYRGTAGEARSLMMASQIAPKLEAFELENTLIAAMAERFQGDHTMIHYRRKHTKSGKLDVLFSGSFKTTDGRTLSFPMDRMGHISLLYFWSKDIPERDARLAEVKELQTKFPGQFDVFSFNLDDLPDAGESILKEQGLNWAALYLPGGKNNPSYKVYPDDDPGAVLVNAYGHALLSTSPQQKRTMPLIPRQLNVEARKKLGFVDKIVTANGAPTLEVSLDSDRYLAQLQSLFVGDFLANTGNHEPGTDSVPAETLAAIKAQFTPIPFRYRLSQKEALAKYTKAEELCRAAIAQHTNAPDLWLVHNHRIIALLGMWNLSTEPKHLEAAVQVAKAALALNPPASARVIPQFCLAKEALRRGDAHPSLAITGFINKTGGTKAPATAIAAATLLALDANDRDLFSRYRTTFLNTHADDPTLWPVTTYLRDRRHRYRMFRATHSRFGFIRAERHAMYRDVSALDEPADTSRKLNVELTALDGKKLSFPQAAADKLTFLTFLELPRDEEAAKQQNTLIKRMTFLADLHEPKGVNVIAAFLSDDKTRISALAKTNEWTCLLAMVPEGLKNQVVRKHGILAADNMPNIFLLRPNGSIAWKTSGLSWPVQGSSVGTGTAIRYGIEASLTVCQMEAAKAALDKGDHKTAIRLFSETSTAKLYGKKVKNDWWATFRLYGTARAHVGIKDWEAALSNITAATDAHIAFNWGKPFHCTLVAEMELYKANILDHLGRKPEADQERKKAAGPTHIKNPSPFGIYNEHLETHRLNPHGGK